MQRTIIYLQATVTAWNDGKQKLVFTRIRRQDDFVGMIRSSQIKVGLGLGLYTHLKMIWWDFLVRQTNKKR